MLKFITTIWEWLQGNSDKEEKVIVNAALEIMEEQDFEVNQMNKEVLLKTEMYKAINECEGCTEEVFVLKQNGVEIGYYSNLNKLATANKFPPATVYRHWKNKIDGDLFKVDYEIIKLTNSENEEDNNLL